MTGHRLPPQQAKSACRGPRLEVADVFHAHQNQFLQRWGHVLSDQQRKVLRDIGRCRKAALGTHLERCDRCAASCSTSCQPGFVKILHFGLLANRNRSQTLVLCRMHLHATPSDLGALLTEPQKSALNLSCPRCKCGTLHVVDRQLSDRTATSLASLAHFDSS